MQKFNAALLAGASVIALTGAAVAAPAVALTGDKTLVMFDTETLAVSGTMDVTGIDRLEGIDVRPGDKLLYGLAGDGSIVTIDTASGAATVKSQLSETWPAGVAASVDFNPVADRMRIVGTDGTNLRVNVDDGVATVDGKLAYDAADMHAGEAPNIVAVAYTNSFGKPEATAMYDVDATIGALIQQAPPNDGVLKAIGKFGIEGATTYAMDIAATEALENTAYLATGGMLYTVAVDTGAATSLGELAIEGDIRDIAILQ
jgi:hypothetical protein